MSLFENTDQTVEAKFEDFVGEGKKYKDQDAAAKALVEKDNFIERLKAENAQVRQELTARPAVDRSQEILDRLENLNREAITERQPATMEPERIEKGLSLDDVERVLNERERRARATANVNAVKQELKAKYGDNYGQALKTMAEKNGLSETALNDLAAQSPQLILNLMGSAPKSEGLFTPPSSSVSLDTQVQGVGGAKPLSHYRKLQATDKAKYFSPAVQNQMYKDGMALQEAFYDVS